MFRIFLKAGGNRFISLKTPGTLHGVAEYTHRAVFL